MAIQIIVGCAPARCQNMSRGYASPSATICRGTRTAGFIAAARTRAIASTASAADVPTTRAERGPRGNDQPGHDETGQDDTERRAARALEEVEHLPQEEALDHRAAAASGHDEMQCRQHALARDEPGGQCRGYDGVRGPPMRPRMPRSEQAAGIASNVKASSWVSRARTMPGAARASQVPTGLAHRARAVARGRGRTRIPTHVRRNGA